MAIRFLIVDGFNLIRRLFEAHPSPDIQPTLSLAKASLQKAIGRHHPTHATVILEHHDTTWRHQLYPEYKASRSPTPDLLLQHLDDFDVAFQQLGVTTAAVPNYEADDVVATMATLVSRRQGEARILSTDRIYLQLVSSRVRLFDHFANKELDAAWFEQEYGIAISQYLDYLALVGEASTNIKGVPKVGKKTAIELLHRYQSLEQMLASQDDDVKLRRVRAAADTAYYCQKLVTLKQDVTLGMNLRQFRLSPPDGASS